MFLRIRHPRDGVRRDVPGVTAGAVHVQAVAFGNQTGGSDRAVAEMR